MLSVPLGGVVQKVLVIIGTYFVMDVGRLCVQVLEFKLWVHVIHKLYLVGTDRDISMVHGRYVLILLVGLVLLVG